MIPKYINETELVRDPHGRAAHWYHPQTDTVLAMPADWKPANSIVSGVKVGDPKPGSVLADAIKELTPKTIKELVQFALEEYELSVSPNQSKEKIIQAIVEKAGYTNQVVEDEREAPEDLTGRRVILLQGRFVDRHAVISESGMGDDQLGVRLILDGDGQEVTFESFEPYLRFLTEEEIAADEAALKEKQEH